MTSNVKRAAARECLDKNRRVAHDMIMSTVSTESGAALHSSRLRVLLVEKNTLVRGAVRPLLRDHTVIEFEEAGSALERISDGASFDIIVLGMLVPERRELYHSLELLNPALTARVVFLSSGSNDAEWVFLRSSGRPIVCKPFDSCELKRVVEMVALDINRATP